MDPADGICKSQLQSPHDEYFAQPGGGGCGNRRPKPSPNHSEIRSKKNWTREVGGNVCWAGGLWGVGPGEARTWRGPKGKGKTQKGEAQGKKRAVLGPL